MISGEFSASSLNLSSLSLSASTDLLCSSTSSCRLELYRWSFSMNVLKYRASMPISSLDETSMRTVKSPVAPVEK